MASPKTCTPTDMAIGRRIAELRAVRLYSQTALGEVLGVSFQQVQKYEAGKNKLSAGRLVSVAKFLGVKVKDLCPETEDEAPKLPTSEELYREYLRAKAAYQASVRREMAETL